VSVGAEALAVSPPVEYTELMNSGAEGEELPAGSQASDSAEGVVNFDEAPLVELELDGTDYRLDAGRAGTALCISTRPTGSWTWTFRGEAKWQANVLRCKAFDRIILGRLGQALKELASSDA
jgi:hypothetical protein